MASKMKTLFCFCLLVLVVGQVFASDVVIPNLLGSGVSMVDYINAAVLLIGSVVAVVVGGYFAFWVVRAGLRWLGSELFAGSMELRQWDESTKSFKATVVKIKSESKW